MTAAVGRRMITTATAIITYHRRYVPRRPNHDNDRSTMHVAFSGGGIATFVAASSTKTALADGTL